jgi:FkbM family methyltransferase
VYRPRPLPHDGVILDVGANIGLAAALFAHYNPERPIYCFEPLSANARMARLNCPRATVENIGLGLEKDRVTLQVDAYSVMASTIDCDWETHEETFDVLPLDTYVQEKGLDKIALIKLDTEGMELDILRGGQQTLQKTQEVVMETHERFRHDESMRLLSEAGFRIDSEAFDGHTGFVFASRRPTAS